MSKDQDSSPIQIDDNTHLIFLVTPESGTIIFFLKDCVLQDFEGGIFGLSARQRYPKPLVIGGYCEAQKPMDQCMV